MQADRRSGIAQTAPLQVLYDGGCPLCRREIGLYRRSRPRRPIDWIDIDADRQAPERFGLSREAAMARFHVIDGDEIRTGAAAFVRLWTALPGWRHLARTVRLTGVEPLMERGYVWFARKRLAERCADGACRVR
ncbi:thiol-disulfide oxidoreductase DCC family protein [Thiocystis violacea]|uniref:thiol-disulfide oxidoreductase DCC family protein n=1 Tax=Thiocystis violacea TaxID=13725 RepID=UPI0019069EE7|nr:DUF393 domain-containing protein [Thiocystis violacea]MBK1716134.1 thiol-disulfide oxidoreductase [Thiocystis violacea]